MTVTGWSLGLSGKLALDSDGHRPQNHRSRSVFTLGATINRCRPLPLGDLAVCRIQDNGRAVFELFQVALGPDHGWQPYLHGDNGAQAIQASFARDQTPGAL